MLKIDEISKMLIIEFNNEIFSSYSICLIFNIFFSCKYFIYCYHLIENVTCFNVITLSLFSNIQHTGFFALCIRAMFDLWSVCNITLQQLSLVWSHFHCDWIFDMKTKHATHGAGCVGMSYATQKSGGTLAFKAMSGLFLAVFVLI